MNSLLFTGSNGFLGKNVIVQLSNMDYDIITLSRDNACINCDLSQAIPSIDRIFDIVIHAAGKAHEVPKTVYENEQFLALYPTFGTGYRRHNYSQPFPEISRCNRNSEF